MQAHSAKGKLHADPLALIREWQFVVAQSPVAAMEGMLYDVWKISRTL